MDISFIYFFITRNTLKNIITTRYKELQHDELPRRIIKTRKKNTNIENYNVQEVNIERGKKKNYNERFY